MLTEVVLRKFAACLLASASVACSGPGAVLIESIVPVDLAGNETASVDTSWEACAEPGSATPPDQLVCEPFGPHFARITVRNDNVADEGDDPGSRAGWEYLTGYALSFKSSEPAPALAPQAGKLSLALPPGETVTFDVVLAGYSTKAEFAASQAALPRRYSVKYELTGPSLELDGAVDVFLGSYDACPEGERAIAACP